jgi:hypothetical protein
VLRCGATLSASLSEVPEKKVKCALALLDRNWKLQSLRQIHFPVLHTSFPFSISFLLLSQPPFIRLLLYNVSRWRSRRNIRQRMLQSHECRRTRLTPLFALLLLVSLLKHRVAKFGEGPRVVSEMLFSRSDCDHIYLDMEKDCVYSF